MAPEEKILLRRKANFRSGKFRTVGTFVITDRDISFRPLAGKKAVSIPLESITDVRMTGVLFKKMVLSADGKDYTVYLKEAKKVIGLLNAIR